MDTAFFLTPDQVRRIRQEFGTPVYVYDQQTLETQARNALAFPHAYGLTVRYAMKALPTAAVVRLFADLGLYIDASSGFEVERAIRAGVSPERIQITAQELPANLKELVERGVWFTACSLSQLDAYGRLFPGTELAVRINPGMGSGHSNRTNVGGPSSAFGIWHERLDDVMAIQQKYQLRLTRMHTHIGSGGDPEVWDRCARLSLAIAARLPEVTRLSLGGGFKVGRMPEEATTDLQVIGPAVAQDFEAFHKEHGRKLHLEIEPGTYLVAMAGVLICNVMDVIDTGVGGYRFIKLDAGMTDLLRPAMYGAQHPMVMLPQSERAGVAEYVVVGHCCESGDLLTPEPGNPEGLAPREFPTARIGDTLIVGGAGAYSSAMAAKNYNSFPESPEVLVTKTGDFQLIRKRQTLDQVLANEI